MRWLSHPALHRLLGLALGAVFVYASADKILHPAEFARIVYRYRLVGPSQLIPPLVPNVFAVTLPWVELLAGLLLIVGTWRREAALLTGAMTAVFIGAVSLALLRGIDLENCGCFTVGAAGRAAGLRLVLADSVMVAAATVLVLGAREPAGGEPAAPPAA